MNRKRQRDVVSYSEMIVKLNADSGQRTIKKKHWCFFERDYKSHRSKDCPVITPIKRCWHCNLPGHIARYCRIDNIYRHERPRKYSKEKFCHFEKRWGSHKSKECPMMFTSKTNENETKRQNRKIFCHFERRWGDHLSRNCPKQFPELAEKNEEKKHETK